MEKFISIIMPAYNAEKYISEAIESVLGQTYTQWELIVVDDGSTDDTKNIINKYIDKDERVFYYFQQNGKQGKARNLGIEKSRGELIAFLDSDDLWLPSKLEASLVEFQKDDQDLLFTNAYCFAGDAVPHNLDCLVKFAVHTKKYSGKEGLAELLFENRVPTQTVLVKKEALAKVGFFRDKGKAEDYELWLHLLAEGFVLRGVDIPLALYRSHEASTSSGDKKMSTEVLWMLTDFFAERTLLKDEFARQKIHWLITVVQSKTDQLEVLDILKDERLKALGLKYSFFFLKLASTFLSLDRWKKVLYYHFVTRNVYFRF